jgi:hypothetical protein
MLPLAPVVTFCLVKSHLESVVSLVSLRTRDGIHNLKFKIIDLFKIRSNETWVLKEIPR